MIVAAPPGQPGSASSRSEPSVAALRHRVLTLDPARDADSPRVRAAVLLLAAREMGLNIDRLARRTGYPRHFVAACARRLFDNGVWESGETRYAWTEEEDAAFWNDVDVALGSLQRRMDEHGHPVWARSGEWHKSYEFTPGDPVEGQAVVFQPSVPPVSPRDIVEPAPLSGSAHRDDLPPVPGAPATPELFPGTSWLG